MNSYTNDQTFQISRHIVVATVVAAFSLGLPTELLAGPDYAGSDQKVCNFFESINGLLNMASVAVVTIAVIFSGYQIAFAHKRITDVAPILIGGVLIGAAAQVAKMIVGDTGSSCTAMVIETLKHYA